MAKILIVDDSTLSRRILRTILIAEGHHIIEATDGLVGIETYLMEQPDLVLLDMAMPGLPGDEVLEKILELNQSARVIIATADLQDLTKTKVLEAGAMGFVNKPFNRTKVLEVVNQVLSNTPDVL
ncbi:MULTISPECIES: response regulator [Planktothricoides]|uniref:Response regulator n=1 Tax=Planktothricoides raciborskii FACHB-1370 TaxID=2949576 RepID=A0ABR8EKH4_9CYAN|nr:MULTISPECIES: response regulator [Planktothricoides]KOR38403.1 histidine kinase [Planktothricoides sp. SR001]MBD2546388.1 response regulator [Planktothricoides raciborskii FACHB-1370]MBD2584786.1 response regulator [Planktothricoides raciborskii FACHB-1261]